MSWQWFVCNHEKGPYGAGLTAPLDDPVKASDYALGGQGKVDL